MFNFSLYFRVVVIHLIVLVMYNLTIINNMYAINQNNNDSSDKIQSYTHIEIPNENLKKIAIIGYKLIYKKYEASLVNFLNEEITDFKKNLALADIKDKNIVIIFTDYAGKTTEKENLFNYKIPPLNDGINYSQYKTDENICINLTELLKKHTLPFLIAKRSILIGTLVNQSILFKGNNFLKVTNFNFPEAKGITFFKDSETQNTKNPVDEENANPSDSSCNNKAYLFDNYYYEELITNRASMIAYMNLNIFHNVELIGMMEYQDSVYKSISYFVLQGNLYNFLYKK